MLSTLTYAVRVETTSTQSEILDATCSAYLDCCNMVSKTAWEHKTLSQKTLGRPASRNTIPPDTTLYGTGITASSKTDA